MRSGLTSSEVGIRRAEFGENRLPEMQRTTWVSILFGQFKSPLIYIILSAAAISLALGERGDFVIIAMVVAIDVGLGFMQEFRAHQTYLALHNLLKPSANVWRDGKRIEVEVWELVPGDLVILAVGDKVPADGTLLESTRVAADEAMLTGESEPVVKRVGDQVFMGSTVVTGRGLFRIDAIGVGTELGRIATAIAAPEDEPTPLQVRLARFSRMLTRVVLVTTCGILAIGLLMGKEFLGMLRTAIVLSIAAIPEGLIIAVTMILVAGMRKVLRRQGLVKRLLAVETLGSVTVVCTDKTGTLTEGHMRVTDTDFTDPALAMRTMVLCNDLEGPVDVALWEFAQQHAEFDPQVLTDGSLRTGEELFTSDTKYMIAAITSNEIDGQQEFCLKGAPEIVLDMCEMDDSRSVLQRIDNWAERGLRCLGLARRMGGDITDYSGYQWLGLVGMEDPIRGGVGESVAVAYDAGIRVLMVTGDHLRTADSIARSIGIREIRSIEGSEIRELRESELQEILKHTNVFARIRPQEKLRIVQALKATGEVVAMIGDGVNDAPALKRADIGVVVGSASDVAKESADLILLDNNFSTVVASIEEGRVIFDNIRKVVAYVLSNSFAELLTIFTAMLLGLPTPLLVAQILWIHLICDGPEDIVLGFEPKENGIMQAPPRSLHESILDRLGITLIALVSGLSALFGLGVFAYFHLVQHDEIRGRSIVFATFAISSIIYILAYRSLKEPTWRTNPITSNRPLIYAMIGSICLAILPFVFRPLGSLLHVVPLHGQEWALVFGFAVVLLLLVDGAKAARSRASSSSPYRRNANSGPGMQP